MASKRHGNGEGSIYQRSDGRWTATISMGWTIGSNGKPKRLRKSFYGRTRQEVAKQLTTAKAAQDRGAPIVSERLTVAGYFTDWIASKSNLRERTRESYQQIIRDHITPQLGKHRLAQLTPAHVRGLMTAKLAQGLDPRTVDYVRAVLRSGLTTAEREGLVARNVAKLVETPAKPRREMTALDPAQARRLLEAANGNPFETLYTVAVSLGLRQGEAFGLRWSRVDLETGRLNVSHQLQKIGGAYRLVEPKADSGRVLAMPGAVLASLRAHKARQSGARLAAGSKWKDGDYVFTRADGRPLTPSCVRHDFERLQVVAEVPRIRFHDLRHSAASVLLAMGVSAKMVQETLGHSQIGTTLNVYAHLFDPERQAAADAMDRALGFAVDA